MRQLPFAAELEASIRQEIETITRTSPGLQPLITRFSKFQVEFELLLDKAQYTDVDTGIYPEVNADVLLGDDNVWQEVTLHFGRQTGKSAIDLVKLWMILALVEKSGQFYQQAASNSPHPRTRIFLSSMAESKSMLKRRIDGALRVMYNEIWADIGHAPFLPGKD